jgi:hypothetical protein
MKIRVCGLLLLTALGSTCGGNNGTPAGPSPSPQPPPAPTVTAVSLGDTIDWLVLTRSQQFSLTASFSDGSSRRVSAAWSTDNSSVVLVASDGTVTGVGPGTARVQATYEGRSAAHNVRVVPEYGGDWRGDYRVARCEDTFDWRGVCDEEDPSATWLLSATFARDLETVTGTVAVYSDLPPTPVSGTIASSGRLTASGSWDGEIEDLDLPFTLQIVDWDVLTLDNAIATGTFTIIGSSRQFDGEYRLFCEVHLDKQAGPAPSGFRLRSDRPALLRPSPLPRLRPSLTF